MRVDDEGYLFFCGRKKQIIVHDSSNICPQEVEGASLEHPSVASAGVIGIHDLVHGETVRAHITFTEGSGRPTSQELIRFAREGRLQGPRGNNRPRRDAAHSHREAGSDGCGTNGGADPRPLTRPSSVRPRANAQRLPTHHRHRHGDIAGDRRFRFVARLSRNSSGLARPFGGMGRFRARRRPGAVFRPR